jgi:hypothetical protein
MKHIFSFLLILSPFFVFSQSDKLEYKGGINKLWKLIHRTTDSDDSIWNKNSIDKNNKLSKEIFIVSSQDIDSMPSLYALMEATKDNWINHTGHDLEVVLPLYYYYDDDTPRKRINTVYHFAYWPKKEILVLDPLIIKRYPTMR